MSADAQQPTIVMSGIQFGEQPRWNKGRLWFSDWGAREVIAVDLDGHIEVVLRAPSFPCCADWLPVAPLLLRTTAFTVADVLPPHVPVASLYLYPAAAEVHGVAWRDQALGLGPGGEGRGHGARVGVAAGRCDVVGVRGRGAAMGQAAPRPSRSGGETDAYLDVGAEPPKLVQAQLLRRCPAGLRTASRSSLQAYESPSPRQREPFPDLAGTAARISSRMRSDNRRWI